MSGGKKNLQKYIIIVQYIKNIMLHLKPQTAYNYDYRETLFLMAIIIGYIYRYLRLPDQRYN